MPEPGDEPLARPKKKEKVRSVWISFLGRIVAQIIGAVASVVLGIFILQRYQDRPSTPAPAAAAAAPVTRSAPASSMST